MTQSHRSPFVAAACGAVAVIGLGLFSTFAIAATPCDKYAGLVDSDGDGFCTFVGAATATTSGWTGDVDCDDARKEISPSAKEIVGDGIDQDCDVLDATWPVGDPKVAGPEVARYQKTYGSSWDPLVFIAEYGRCKAAAECKVDDVGGTLEITEAASKTHVFADIYDGTSKILLTDGIREVVTREAASHFAPGGAAKKASSTYTGPSKETRKAEAREVATEVVTGAVAAERADREAWQSRQDAEDDVRDDHINNLWAGQEDLAEGLAAEERARIAAIAEERRQREIADGEIAAAVEKAQRKAEKAERDAGTALEAGEAAQSHGPLVEGYAQGGIVAGRGTAEAGRNPLGFGGGAGVNFGIDGRYFRVNGFADLLVGVDGGAGPAHSESVGAEATFAIGSSDVHIGPHLAWSTRTSQSDALAASVVGRNPLVGITVAAPFGGSGAGHGLFQVRAGCGPEFVGAATGAAREQLEAGLGCRATVGIGGGVGALRRE